MTSQTIEWHKNCFINSQVYLRKKKKRLDELELEIKEMIRKQEFYSKQIDEAEKKGKKKFDSDKFLVKRK